MKTLFTLLTALLITSTLLFAGPAKRGLLTFSQPDGTTFKGYLKGTSAFHWIESNGEIIKYNENNKFYHVAIFDSNNSLIITERLPSPTSTAAPSSLSTQKNNSLNATTLKKLMNLYKEHTTKFSPE